MRSSKWFGGSGRVVGLAGVIVAAGVASAPAARAALVVSTASSALQTTFDVNILSNDLVNNGSTSRAGVTTTGSVAAYGGDVPPNNAFDHLTDGGASSKVSNNDISKDTYFDGPAFTTNPSITYNLNTTASPQGYNLTQIRSISGWADTTDFSNQRYRVSVALVGAPTTFNVLSDVTYTPFTGNALTPNSSQVTITDNTGTIATGVAAIKFEFLSNGGVGQVFREIDVQGTPAPEPGSAAALIGVAGAAAMRRRRRRPA